MAMTEKNLHLDNIRELDALSNTECFSNHYSEIFNRDSFAFSSPLQQDVAEIYNNILKSYPHLTTFQKEALQGIISAFDQIRKQIDPDRLKDFKVSINEDGDLLLFRQSAKGLTNLIIHEEDDFAYSFIGLKEGRTLKFFENNTDFESVALKFFSN